jgi:hypothetical protein
MTWIDCNFSFITQFILTKVNFLLNLSANLQISSIWQNSVPQMKKKLKSERVFHFEYDSSTDTLTQTRNLVPPEMGHE